MLQDGDETIAAGVFRAHAMSRRDIFIMNSFREKNRRDTSLSTHGVQYFFVGPFLFYDNSSTICDGTRQGQYAVAASDLSTYAFFFSFSITNASTMSLTDLSGWYSILQAA